MRRKLCVLSILLLIGSCDRFDSYEFDIDGGEYEQLHTYHR